jgi:centromere/kinetochore protein ZW10
VELLRKELDFNVTLADTLEQLQIISGLLDSAQNAASEGSLSQSLEKLQDAQKIIGQLDSYENTRFAGLVQRRASQLKELLVGRVQDYWHAMVIFSSAKREITILNDLPGEIVSSRLKCHLLTSTSGESELSIDLQQVISAMSELHMLDTHVSRLHRDLDAAIIAPRFNPAADGAVSMLEVGDNTIHLLGRDDTPSAESLLKDVGNLIKFLTKTIPNPALDSLLEKLLPSLVVQLITEWLEPVVPVQPEAMAPFQEDLNHILELAEIVERTGVSMPSDADLSAWVDKLPQTWLARRREAALTAMRSACYEEVKTKKRAERVETQMVSGDDMMVSGGPQEDDWNADWGEGAEEEDTHMETTAHAGEHQDSPMEDPTPAEEDEDASAWDEGDGAEEAWGWGDDEAAPQEEEAVAKPSTIMAPPPKPTPKANGTAAAKSSGPSKREVTLRETFAVTSIPDSVLELVNDILVDAETLSQPEFPISSISAAAPALSSIPTLLLALYRATARTFYASDPAGDMLIYNDSQHLATSLQTLLSDLPPDHPLHKRLQRSLEADIKLLSTFSRLAYGREMDSQRTILSDLLSGTGGFADCTNARYAMEYRSAIDDVVARVRQVDMTWKGVLSDSARLQSLGALLGHVIRKVIEDILELADEPSGISEEQSKTLKEFCDQIAELKDLFQPQEPGADSMVHIYTPSWIRFDFLGQILEGSLADIQYFWTEAGMNHEFEASEIVGLIEALFAESQVRKNAIRKIRELE